VDVFVLRTDRFLVGGECFDFELARIIAFLSGSTVVTRGACHQKLTEPYFVFEMAPIHNTMPIYSQYISSGSTLA
jgi:hypothetical protein